MRYILVNKRATTNAPFHRREIESLNSTNIAVAGNDAYFYMTTDGEIVYNIVLGTDMNTQGRSNVDCYIANGYLYQPNHSRTSDAPEDDPRAVQLSRVSMEYWPDNILIQFRLDQIGCADPARVKISYLSKGTVNTLPVTADSDPEPYAVSCQHAHIRFLNPNRSFLGAVYWGRFLYNDIYRFVTPEETLGCIVQSGASGIMAYGWCGMDDGGLLHRMEEGFMDSLARGNAWAKMVIPRLGARKKSRTAILYPTAMALLEPLAVESG